MEEGDIGTNANVGEFEYGRGSICQFKVEGRDLEGWEWGLREVRVGMNQEGGLKIRVRRDQEGWDGVGR